MTSRITIRDLARADLFSIFEYTTRQWDLAQAERYLHQIDKKLRALATHHELGRDRPDIGKGVRIFLAGNHLLVYRPRTGGIDLLRVVHSSRDLRTTIAALLPPARK